jgi:hypothetical protein
MSHFGIEQIRAVVQVAQDDPTLLATLKAERVTLVTDITQNPEAGKEIISGSGNGLSHSAQLGYTKNERLAFLNKVIRYIDNGWWPSSTSYARY